MFDKLIDVVTQFWEDLCPFFILSEYEKAVVLRYGKYKDTYNLPNIYWKIPFFDNVLCENVVWTTMELPPQTIATADGENIVVVAIIKYRISDIKKFCLRVEDAVDALSDTTQGIIYDVITSATWEECHNSDLDGEITKESIEEAKHWGIELSVVTITNLAKIKSYRIIGDFGIIPEDYE